MATDARTVVLVEGLSDRVALEVLADRSGRDLGAEGVAIVPTGGASAVGTFAASILERGTRLAGLYDVGEVTVVGRQLERAGAGTRLDRAGLEAIGFFACDADLEDELIRALGVDGVEDVLARQGDLASFRRVQRQPAQRDRPVTAQLHRFLGTRSGRKWHYAALLDRRAGARRRPAPADAPPGRRLNLRSVLQNRLDRAGTEGQDGLTAAAWR